MATDVSQASIESAFKRWQQSLQPEDLTKLTFGKIEAEMECQRVEKSLQSIHNDRYCISFSLDVDQYATPKYRSGRNATEIYGNTATESHI
jgi:hypothetical protein